MKTLYVLLAAAAMGCAMPVTNEQIDQSSTEVRTSTVILQPVSTVAVNGAWTHSPSGQALHQILGDYGAANPNASYAQGRPGTNGADVVGFSSPNVFACNGIISVQSVTAQYRVHTLDANERFYFEVRNPAGAEGAIGCGNLPPWTPVGYAFDCGSSVNPITGANWTKTDIGCSGGAALRGGYEGNVNSGIVWEAMQVRVTVTTL